MKSENFLFDYDCQTSSAVISERAAELLGTDRTTLNISDENPEILKNKSLLDFIKKLKETSPKNPETESIVQLDINGVQMCGKIVARTMWTDDKSSEYTGIIGKISNFQKVTEKKGVTI